MKIFIIDDDLEFASVVGDLILKDAQYSRKSRDEIEIRHFTNALEAINATADEVPDLILLDILLDGPDGFTFLNEMQSYEDLAKVPIILMTSLNMTGKDLSRYGVVGVLNKSEMTPEQMTNLIMKLDKSGVK